MIADDLLARLLTGIDDALPCAHELRRALHRTPSVGGFEEPTRDLLAAWMPWAVSEPTAGTGLAVRVGPGGASVALRAELDALPLREATGVPWAATGEAAHACGHDVHMAAAWAVLEAARGLDLPAGLVALFQPREENQPSGARDVVREGVLQRHDVRAVIGAHVQPRIPLGTVSTGVGAVNAAFDEFEIVVQGRPGHGAYPQSTSDPVPILANIVTTTHELVSRLVDPTHPAVITVGRLRAGDTANVIAADASCQGMIRSTTEADRRLLHDGLRRLCRGLGEARGVQVDVSIDLGGPALHNDADLVAATNALLPRSGLAVAESPMRSCGSDDFSYYGEQAPILMIFVGTGDGRTGPGLHHPGYLPPERSVADVARSLACATVGALSADVLSRTAPGD